MCATLRGSNYTSTTCARSRTADAARAMTWQRMQLRRCGLNRVQGGAANVPEAKGVSGRDGGEPALSAIRVPGWAYPALTIFSLLMGGSGLVRGTSALHTAADSDLTNFFFNSATYILNGDPWHMYAVRASGAYPNYNPPLSMFLMAPLLGLARAFGA